MQHRIGAHLSIAGGHHNALNSIIEKGGNSLQIFSSSPRGWNFANPSDEQIQLFLKLKHDLDVDPVYFHASYLINLADDTRIGRASINSLTHELKLAPQMEIRGSIVHLGSFKENENTEKYALLTKNIKEILEKTHNESLFIIENAGTRKIGQTLEQIAHILKDVNDDRVRVCLDTCHLHAAGYDLTSQKAFELFLQQFDSLIGLEKLELWHFNDSKDPNGSLRDRHENIGQGKVGTSVFKNILNHPLTKHIPCILETPGFEGNGPDKKNLDIVKPFIQ